MVKHAKEIAEHCPSGKTPYLSLAVARKAGRLVQHDVGKPMRPYRCRTCRQYHLTSQAKFKKEKQP